MEGWQVFFEIPGKPPVELPDGESIIGRSRSSIVHIPETTVSRQHARVQVSGPGQVQVEDLGSSNGTFVNGEKIEGARKLGDGDHVTVGDAEMVIRILAPIEPYEATVRLSVPPMTAPAPPAPPIPPPPVAAPAPAAAPAAVAAPPAPAGPPPPAPPAATSPAVAPPVPAPPAPSPAVAPPIPAPPPPSPAVAAPAPPLPPRPADLPLRPPPPPPRPAAPAPPVSPAATKPSAPAPPAAAAPPAGKQEVLGSIEELEKMPLPPKKSGAVPAAAMAAAPGAVRYGGFWIRTVAYLLDMVPIMVLSAVSVAVPFFVDPRIGSFVGLAVMVVVALYGFWDAWMLPATRGYTLGKKMLGLAITTDPARTGVGLGWGKAFVRLIGLAISGAVFGIGFLLVAFTSKKQGLHDMIAGTFVVRTK